MSSPCNRVRVLKNSSRGFSGLACTAKLGKVEEEELEEEKEEEDGKGGEDEGVVPG